MKFIGKNDLVVNNFYMNYISGGRQLYAFYLTDEVFTDHAYEDDIHYKIKPLYNCDEVVAISPIHDDSDEADASLQGENIYQLTEEEGLLIGDMFS